MHIVQAGATIATVVADENNNKLEKKGQERTDSRKTAKGKNYRHREIETG